MKNSSLTNNQFRFFKNNLTEITILDLTGYLLGWLDFPLFSRIVSELMAKVVYPCQ